MFAIWAVVSVTSDAVADRRAIARAARGETSALAELYDRHVRLVYSLALRIVRNTADAEDVVQEVFAQVWQQAARYESARGNVAAWLTMLTRSRAIDRVRRRGNIDGGAAAEAANDLPAQAVPVDDQLVSSHQAAAVRDAVGGLPLTHRVAIELAFYEGLTHGEISDRLEWPLGTVKTRIRQGLLRLRDVLSGAV